MKLIGRFFGLLTTLLNAADLLFATAVFLGVVVWLPLEPTRDFFPGRPLALLAPFAAHTAVLAVARGTYGAGGGARSAGCSSPSGRGARS